jgi:hypothetical protein
MARDVTVARQREDVEVLDPWRGRCDDTFENRAGLQVLELFHSSTNFAILKCGDGLVRTYLVEAAGVLMTLRTGTASDPDSCHRDASPRGAA